MEWTNRPPTEPGHYWVRNGILVGTALVIKQTSGMYVLTVNGPAGSVQEFVDNGVEWYGPLSPPE
jgi:hypothetical protein